MTSDHPGQDVADRSQVVFHKVGECLYRLESTGGYYALVKRRGKQFRRSLKTTDRKLAERRLADVRQKVERLARSDDANRTFEEVAGHWVDLTAGELKPRSLDRRRTALKSLAPYFHGTAIRNFSRAQCERWAKERGTVIAPQTFDHGLPEANHRGGTEAAG